MSTEEISENPLLGFKPAPPAERWEPSANDVARQKVLGFFKSPYDQMGEIIQACSSSEFEYFEANSDKEDHRRIWLCYKSLKEHLDPGKPHEIKGGWDCVYVASTINEVTDDRLLFWRKQPDDARSLEKFKGGYRTDLTGNQFLEQMVDWANQFGITNAEQLSAVLDAQVPNLNNNAVLNLFKNFKPPYQHLWWGSFHNQEGTQ